MSYAPANMETYYAPFLVTQVGWQGRGDEEDLYHGHERCATAGSERECHDGGVYPERAAVSPGVDSLCAVVHALLTRSRFAKLPGIP